MSDFPNIDQPEPVGPIWTGGFEETVVSQDGVDYTLLYLPDKHNDIMQQAGKPPVYYWVPNGVRLAQKPNGDLKFFCLHFAGVQTGSTTVGVIPGVTREITGGALSFTVTTAPPNTVLQKAHGQILNTWKDKGDRYTMYRSSAPAPTLGDPAFLRPLPIASNNVSVTNASMNPDGSLTSGGGTDPFFWKMQGQGPGATDAFGENSFTCMMGSTAAEIVAAGFKANQSIISVIENLQIPMWAPIASLTMTSDWERCFNHISVAAQAKYYWSEADVKSTWNDLRVSGAIKVDIEIDKTLPGSDDQEKTIENFITMLIPMWIDQAKQVIFQPAPNIPDAQAAAPGGPSGCFGSGAGLGVGVSMQFRRDKVEMANSFQFKSDQRYLQSQTIGGTLDGLADLLKKDPTQLRKYFGELYLDDEDRMITVACRPDVNWPDPSKKWTGDPVNMVSVELGYPNTSGAVEWSGNVFTPPANPSQVVPDNPAAGLPTTTPGQTNPAAAASAFISFADGSPSTVWFGRMTQKQAIDVANAPKDWTPDKMYVKRSIVFNSALPDTDNPYVRQRVEVDRIDLDGQNGTLTNELAEPIKCDHTGVLDVGPIALGATLSGNWTADIALKPNGTRRDGTSRADDEVRFTLTTTDQHQQRYWNIYTGQPDYSPTYSYQVTINRNADISDAAPPNDGWVGPWVDAAGNGPLTLRPPRLGEPGVAAINPQ